MTAQPGDRFTLTYGKLELACLIEAVTILDGKLYDVTAYSMRDPRWKDEVLGYSGQSGVEKMTIGTHGCALCVVAMILSRFDVDRSITPLSLNHNLQDNNGFSGGNLIWERVPELYQPEAPYVLEFNGPAQRDRDGDLVWRNIPADMERTWAELAKGPLPIEVDYYPGGTEQPHFVLGMRRLPADGGDSADIEILDPWDAARTTILRRYGTEAKPTISRWVYGLRLLQIRNTEA